MLTAHDLWFRYRPGLPWVLRGIDVMIEPGQVVGLAGPSGCGKSTLGRVLAGFARPQRGRVLVDGTAPGGAPGPHPVQYVSQHPERGMDPRWKVSEILAESGADRGRIAALDGALVKVDWLTRFPHELSGGELQRVNLARALLAEPRYLVADEISASLDAITQARTWRLLLDRVRDRGVGVLAISHDAGLLGVVADRVIDMSTRLPAQHVPVGLRGTTASAGLSPPRSPGRSPRRPG